MQSALLRRIQLLRVTTHLFITIPRSRGAKDSKDFNTEPTCGIIGSVKTLLVSPTRNNSS